MAGGFGTRLRPLTLNIPKPMVPLVNKPLIYHVIKLLEKHDIDSIVTLLYFQPEKIISHLKEESYSHLSIRHRTAVADYGTAGSVKRIADEIEGTVVIFSGDVLSDIDLTAALAFHKEKGALVTIVLTKSQDTLDFGIVRTDKSGRIQNIIEKPGWGQVISDTVNTGIYIIEPQVMEYVPANEEFDFSKDLFPLLLAKELPCYGYVHGGYWRDIGNLNQYLFGQLDCLNKEVETDADICDRIDNDINIDKSVIGRNVKLGNRVSVVNSVIGDNVTIGDGSVLAGATVWKNSSIGNNCHLNYCVIGSDTKIGDDTTIFENAFISDNCNIGNEVTVLQNIKIWAGKTIRSGALVNRSLVQEDKWSKRLFKDARISGVANIDINPEFAAKIGAAFGMAIGRNTRILASRDSDNVSRMIKRAFSAGLMSVGVSIQDIRNTSIPQTRQELRTEKYNGGVHIRKSSRDDQYTDIILMSSDGSDIGLGLAKKIERFYFGEDIKRTDPESVGDINYPERTNEIYTERFINGLDHSLIKSKGFEFVIDYSYGLSVNVLPHILGRLNCKTLAVNNYTDHHKFSPLEDEKDVQLGNIVRFFDSSFGVKIEQGAEKIKIMKKDGSWISSYRLAELITYLFLSTQKGVRRIGATLPCTKVIDMLCEKFGVELVRLPNSHASMMDYTKERGLQFVAGIYGGFVFTDFLFASDGMFTVGKLLEMLAQYGKSIDELDEETPRTHLVKRAVYCPWEKKAFVMRRIIEDSAGKDCVFIEGIKIIEPGSSIFIYPEKENEDMVIFVESGDRETLRERSEYYIHKIKGWVSGNEDK